MHVTEFLGLVRKHKTAGCLLDSNLLLVYLTGLCDPDVERFKRTSDFSKQDFALIASLLQFFDRRVTTPNIVTEASNLLSHMPQHHRNRATQGLSEFVVSADEIYIPSRQATDDEAHARLGVSDVATIKSAHQTPEPLVLTTDLALHIELGRRGRASINYNHVRSYEFLSGIEPS